MIIITKNSNNNNNISVFRIARWTLACLIVFISFAFVFGVGIASAETGNVTLTSVQQFDNNVNVGSAGGETRFNQIRFYSTSWNSLSSLWVIVNNNAFFKLNSNYTFFTISSGGTGGGTASYNKNGSIINLDFDSNTVITSNIINLTYETNIFDSTNVQTTGSGYAIEGADATHPACFASTYLSRCLWNPDSSYYFTQLHSIVKLNTVHNYNISYTATQFYGNVNKLSTTINTKVSFQNELGSKYYIESAYTTTNFNLPFINYGQGLYINVSTPTAAVVQLINATGIIPGDNIAEDNINPKTGVGIVFNKESYAVGDVANISWIRIDPTPISLQDFIILTKPDGTQLELVSSPADTGFTKILMSELGTYSVLVRRCAFFCIAYYTLDSDTALVSDISNPAYILINSTVPTKTNVPIIYDTGRSSLSGYITGNKSLMMLEVREYVGTEFVSPKYYNLVNTSGTIYHIFPTVGTYKVSMFDYLRNEQLAEQVVTATYQPEDIILEKIKTSYITSDKALYYFGEAITGSYGIDDTNYSEYNIFVALMNATTGDIYCSYNAGENFDLGTGTFLYDFVQQSGNYYMGCVKGIGVANITMYRINNSSLEKIAAVSFNISKTNSDGYGLKVSNMGCQKYSISATSPVIGRLEIIDYTGKVEKYYNFTSTLSIVYQAKTKSQYTFNLYDPSYTLQISQIVPGASECLILPETTYPGVNGTWKSTQENIASTCNFWDGWVRTIFGSQGVNDVTRLQFALFLIGAIMFLGMIASRGNFGVAVSLGFIPYAFFAYLSMSTPCGQYMPLWVTIFISLIIGIKMRWFS